jgi:hypothetical protein
VLDLYVVFDWIISTLLKNTQWDDVTQDKHAIDQVFNPSTVELIFFFKESVNKLG